MGLYKKYLEYLGWGFGIEGGEPELKFFKRLSDPKGSIVIGWHLIPIRCKVAGRD